MESSGSPNPQQAAQEAYYQQFSNSNSVCLIDAGYFES
jgi:hypothetical protein